VATGVHVALDNAVVTNRILSLNFREALFAPESGEVPIFLLTITHASLSEPIRLTTDPTEVATTDPELTYKTESRGNDYLYVGVDVTVPNEEDRSPPASKLTISNVTRDLIPFARSVSTPPAVKIEAVLKSDPDTVELEFPQMDMINLTYNAAQLEFDLVIDSLTAEAYPAGTFSPSQFPALFFS
jgi:ABC-type cobalt transport system substrate-binding protein